MKRFIRYCIYAFLLVLLFIIGTNTIFYLATKSYIFNTVADASNVDVVLIPGAAIFQNGALSPIFLDRVNSAIALYQAKKVKKVLVSGDNSIESYNEVNPVRLYLISKGIPDQDIFLDHAGFDTYSTMYRARDIFGVTTVIIATQSFHLPRAIFIARRLGMEAYGINADVGIIPFKNNIREIFANEKAVFNLVLHRKPKYLGETMFITGDGRDNR